MSWRKGIRNLASALELVGVFAFMVGAHEIRTVLVEEANRCSVD